MLFYVYEHWRPDKNECFYVGKGKRRRANQVAARNSHHLRIQAKLARLGMCVEVRLVASGLSEEQAFSLERERISFWRNDGAKLANHTDGGEGTSGWRANDEQRKKLSERHKGKIVSEETRKRMGAAQKGKVVSAETRAKASASHKGVRVSEETKKKLSAALRGRKRSAEVRKRMAEAIKKSHADNPRSPEVRARIGAAQLGIKRKPHSLETKARMSASAKAWRAARRLQRQLAGR